jgi:hypothetical protein
MCIALHQIIVSRKDNNNWDSLIVLGAMFFFPEIFLGTSCFSSVKLTNFANFGGKLA